MSWIEVRVTDASDGRARVELDHLAEVEAHWDEFGPGAVGLGWDLAVVGLGQHLTGESGPDYEELQAWTAGDEARAFLSRAGEAWHDADVASGTDPADARRRADATIAAYTARS